MMFKCYLMCIYYISSFFHFYLMVNSLLQRPIISECLSMQLLSTRDAVRNEITIHDRNLNCIRFRKEAITFFHSKLFSALGKRCKG